MIERCDVYHIEIGGPPAAERPNYTRHTIRNSRSEVAALGALVRGSVCVPDYSGA